MIPWALGKQRVTTGALLTLVTVGTTAWPIFIPPSRVRRRRFGMSLFSKYRGSKPSTRTVRILRRGAACAEREAAVVSSKVRLLVMATLPGYNRADDESSCGLL